MIKQIFDLILSAGKGLIKMLRGEADFEFLKKYGWVLGAVFLMYCTGKSLIELKKANRRAGK